MTDNKMKILQRLEAGEITADEALAMMNQVKEQPSPPPPSFESHSQSPPPHQGGYHSHQDYEYHHTNNWVDGLLGWVGETVEDITSGIKDMEVGVNLPDILRGAYSHNKTTQTFVSKSIGQSLAQLELYGKNDKIEIYGYEGDCVQISCAYDARRPGQHVYFHDENGHISLTFDEKIMRSVRIMCKVPRVHLGQIHAVTKNAAIQLMDVQADDIQLETKNETIFLEKTSCKGLSANSRNGNIKAFGISGGEILLETTNAKIVAEDINASHLTLKTSNAGIKTDHLNVEHLYLKTTNAGVKLDDMFPTGGFAFWDNERTLEVYTTNGGIKVFLPSDIGVDIEANTTGGKVTCDLPLYFTDDSVKARLRGESVNYAGAGRRLKALLNTTNASIKIRER